MIVELTEKECEIIKKILKEDTDTLQDEYDEIDQDLSLEKIPKNYIRSADTYHKIRMSSLERKIAAAKAFNKHGGKNLSPNDVITEFDKMDSEWQYIDRARQSLKKHDFFELRTHDTYPFTLCIGYEEGEYHISWFWGLGSLDMNKLDNLTFGGYTNEDLSHGVLLKNGFDVIEAVKNIMADVKAKKDEYKFD